MQQGRPSAAADVLQEALARFAGEALSDFTDEGWVLAERSRLAEHPLLTDQVNDLHLVEPDP